MDKSLSKLEYHVLLSLGSGALYGYAITAAVAEESDGTLTPRAGTLYRVMARLMSKGLVRETEPPEGREDHPGKERRWYALTPEGKKRLAEETRRLSEVAARARRRLGMDRT